MFVSAIRYQTVWLSEKQTFWKSTLSYFLLVNVLNFFLGRNFEMFWSSNQFRAHDLEGNRHFSCSWDFWHSRVLFQSTFRLSVSLTSWNRMLSCEHERNVIFLSCNNVVQFTHLSCNCFYKYDLILFFVNRRETPRRPQSSSASSATMAKRGACTDCRD